VTISLLGRAFDRSTSELLLNAAKRFENRKACKHTLLLLSCYVDPPSIKNLLSTLLDIVNLTSVDIAFDISEAFRIGPALVKRQFKELREWCKTKKIRLRWRALCAGTLVHSKGYSLYQTKKSPDEIIAGSLLVGSSNLTRPGFFEARNVELGYVSDQLDEVVSFINVYRALAAKFEKKIDSDIFNKNEALFRFSLLSAGIFLHKWDGSLSKLVGIRYQMTAKGRQNTQLAPEFLELGIEPGNSVTLQPIGLQNLPQKSISGAFVRKYTIDTLLGRWCPLDVWRAVEENIKDQTKFVEQFRDATSPERMKEVLKRAKVIQSSLLKKRLIKPVPSGFLNSWNERIKELRGEPNGLSRLIMGYEELLMSYDVGSEREIRGLFESLQWSINNSRNKNFAKVRVLAAIKDKSLKPLRLSAKIKKEIVTDCASLAKDDPDSNE